MPFSPLPSTERLLPRQLYLWPTQRPQRLHHALRKSPGGALAPAARLQVSYADMQGWASQRPELRLQDHDALAIELASVDRRAWCGDETMLPEAGRSTCCGFGQP